MPAADDPLLRAVEARPADDAARLAYADWLDEHARPAEAAFLRAEVRWQRRDPAAPGWFARGRELLRAARATPDDWRERVSRPRLAGTTWGTWWNAGELVGSETVEFLPDGRLRHVSSDRDEDRVEVQESDGAWKQHGPRVLLTINNFSVFRGTARANALPLRGRPIAAGNATTYWQMTLTPPPGPDCLRDPR